MSLMLKSQLYNKSTRLSDEALVKQLTELIRQNVSYSKRLDVLGILSYTTDNGLEKFIKIDSSFDALPVEIETRSNPLTLCYSQDPKIKKTDDTDNESIDDIISHSEIDLNRLNHSLDASPPILPPSALHVNRVLRQDEKVDEFSEGFVSNQHEHCSLLNDTDIHENGFRRYRRKCRRPKRQIIDSDIHAGDSDLEDVGTDVEDSCSFSKQSVENVKIPKLCRIDYTNLDFMSMEVNKKDILKISTSVSKAGSCSDTQNSSSLTVPNSLAFVSLPYATMNKYTNPQISSIDVPISLNNQTGGPATKYAITAKSLGLDFGELCGILPVNTLLNKTLVSNTDSNFTSKLLFANCAPHTPISINNIEGNLTSQLNQTAISNSSSTQNILLNPNLAAAVAAIISNSNNQGANSSNLANINTPSIALTGPSGEILGTIPIASGNASQNFISSGLGNSQILNSSLNNSLSAISVTMPINVNAVSSPALASTLNWLRYATNPNETSAIPLFSQANAINTNSSFNSGNPVALLHSLVTQQQQNLFQQVSQSQISKQQPMSVGPTLALIGTLGLNSSSIPNTNTVSTISDTNMISLNGPITPQVTNLFTTNNIGNTNNNNNNSGSSCMSTNTISTTSNNNGAALIAAALLKSLANSKSINQDPVETPLTHYESGHSTIPGSVTLITNNLPSINLSTSNRANIIGLDDSTASLSHLSTNKITGLNYNSAATNITSTTTAMNNNNNNNTNNELLRAMASSIGANPSRNSIMFSYPRGTSEMNLVLTPASMTTFNTTSNTLCPLTAVPTALSFQSCLAGSQTTNLALASPVLLHASSGGASVSLTQTTCTILNAMTTSTAAITTNVISGTTATSTTLGPTQITNSLRFLNSQKLSGNLTVSNVKSAIMDSNAKESVETSDPTASAIDRILQTIKGCMNQNSNRDSDLKIKTNLPTKKSTDLIPNHHHHHHKDEHEFMVNSKKHLTAKIAPSLALKSSPSSIISTTHIGQNLKISKSSHDRLPIPSLHKTSVDSNESHSPIPISKVYRCRYCGKTFNRKFCRERHERLHTGVKPYTCEICDEKFIRLEDKKRHVRSLQHYLSSGHHQHRRSSPSLFKAEVLNTNQNQSIDELLHSNFEPSSALPLLAQTLQTTMTTTTTTMITGDSDLVVKESDDPTEYHSDLLRESVEAMNNDGDETIEDDNGNDDDNNNNDDGDNALKSAQLLSNLKSNNDRESQKLRQQPSVDLLNNLRLSSNNSSHHRTKLRSDLSDCKIGIKLPTVVIVSNTDMLKQSMGDA